MQQKQFATSGSYIDRASLFGVQGLQKTQHLLNRAIFPCISTPSPI